MGFSRRSMEVAGLLALCVAGSWVQAQNKAIVPNESLPRPVPVLEHIVGTTTSLDLARHLPQLTSLGRVSARDGLTVTAQGTSLTVVGDQVGLFPVELDVPEQGFGPTTVMVRSIKRPQVTFRFRPKGTEQAVSVVGGFNGWTAGRNSLSKQSDGTYSGTLAMDAGTYEYKFVVDGNWIADPDNPERKSDGYQGFNSILTVQGAGPAGGRLVQARMERHSGILAVDSLTTGPAPKLEESSVQVLIGNRPSRDFSIKDGSIVLSLPQSGPAQAVRVYARDQEGREILPAEFVYGGGRTWRDEVMYFVFTDRFRDGNKENNKPIQDPELAPAANFQGGDFDGIRQSIEEGYFAKLGVTTLWISPPQRQPEAAWKDAIPPNRFYTGYHGYWPVAAREVNPHFGTTESLKMMVAAAHARGIKVIMDCVANHVHVDHPYYKQHPEWFGRYDLPDGRKNLRLFDEYPLTTWFDTFLPKFDYARNPDAVATVVEDMAWWVETFGFDGLRHDATKHIPHEFWTALTRRIREIEKGRSGAAIYQVGESIASRDVIMDYVNATEMDGQFDFPLYWPIRNGVASQNEGLIGLTRAMAENRQKYGGFSIHSAFVGNHDFSRFMAFASGAVAPGGADEKEVAWANPPKQPTDKALYDRLRIAHTFVMVQPDQVPLIYYGDEWGLTGAGDPDNRRMMAFGRDVPEAGRAVMAHIGRLTEIRRKYSALRSGDSTPLHEAEGSLILLRSNFSERLVVAFNRTDKSLTVPARVPAWAVDSPGAPQKVKMLLGDKGARMVADEGPGQFVVTIPAQSSAIFLLEK